VRESSPPAPSGRVDAEPDGAVLEVDATGMSCPMPVIELARAIAGIDLGARVRLIATDPAATVDVPVWCRLQRHRLLRQDERSRAWHFLVERGR
jgi:TusA-related sulfurtransferase